jgi:hypothetical protein
MFRILRHTFGVFWRKKSTWKRIVMADTTSTWHTYFTRLKTGSLSTETVCNASTEAYWGTLAVSGTVTKCRESQPFKISRAVAADYSNSGVTNNLLPIRQAQHLTCYDCQNAKLILKWSKKEIIRRVLSYKQKNSCAVAKCSPYLNMAGCLKEEGGITVTTLPTHRKPRGFLLERKAGTERDPLNHENVLLTLCTLKWAAPCSWLGTMR